jgi:hypothetical protein
MMCRIARFIKQTGTRQGRPGRYRPESAAGRPFGQSRMRNSGRSRFGRPAELGGASEPDIPPGRLTTDLIRTGLRKDRTSTVLARGPLLPRQPGRAMAHGIEESRQDDETLGTCKQQGGPGCGYHIRSFERVRLPCAADG